MLTNIGRSWPLSPAQVGPKVSKSWPKAGRSWRSSRGRSATSRQIPKSYPLANPESSRAVQLCAAVVETLTPEPKCGPIPAKIEQGLAQTSPMSHWANIWSLLAPDRPNVGKLWPMLAQSWPSSSHFRRIDPCWSNFGRCWHMFGHMKMQPQYVHVLGCSGRKATLITAELD